MSEFKSGGIWERKSESTKKKRKATPKVVRKVIQKSKCRHKIYTSRNTGALEWISHSTVQRIFKFTGITYKSYSKRLPLAQPRREKRVTFARRMQKQKKQWENILVELSGVLGAGGKL